MLKGFRKTISTKKLRCICSFHEEKRWIIHNSIWNNMILYLAVLPYLAREKINNYKKKSSNVNVTRFVNKTDRGEQSDCGGLEYWIQRLEYISVV